MRRTLISAALGLAAIGFTAMDASAACSDRKVTGTVLGAVGGGLVGNAISSHGAAGTLIGAGVGGVVGHEIGRSGCYSRRTYYRTRRAPAYSRAAPQPYRSAVVPASCRYETRAFYDGRGRLVYTPVQVCG